MASLTSAAIADLVVATQKDLGEYKLTDLTTDITEHYAMPIFFKRETTAKTGSSLQWNLLTSHNSRAAWTGLWNSKTYAEGDALLTASVPWRFGTTDYGFDERETEINSGKKRQVLDLIKIRRHRALVSWAELLEAAFWTKPASSSDTTTPFGLEYYIVVNASTGFNGGNPSGFTSGAGGVSSSTYTRWANYTAQYTNVSKTDAIRKWRTAAERTNFKPPVNVEQYAKGHRYGYYTNLTVKLALEEILEDQNENLGNDVASKDGDVMFRKVPVKYVPYLDDSNYPGGDSQDRIYGIDWESLDLVFLEGEKMRESKPRNLSSQPRVQVVDIDNAFNLVCYDRRRNFVLATA